MKARGETRRTTMTTQRSRVEEKCCPDVPWSRQSWRKTRPTPAPSRPQAPPRARPCRVARTRPRTPHSAPRREWPPSRPRPQGGSPASRPCPRCAPFWSGRRRGLRRRGKIAGARLLPLESARILRGARRWWGPKDELRIRHRCRTRRRGRSREGRSC